MADISTCKHPLKAFIIGVNPETGKDILKVTPYEVNHLWRRSPEDKYNYVYDDYKAIPGVNYTKFKEIPCGKCIACRLKRSREWADRCMLELPYHKKSYFVTLTYDDKHIPFGDVVDENGFLTHNYSLKKSDLQKFFKRLRKNYKKDNHIKYYACGEYGSDEHTHRPHYHAIIFGLELDDLEVYKQSRLGFNYYNSAFLNSCWPFGYVVIADVSWDTCAYTARYILKKQLGEKSDIYDILGIEPEFNAMSLKPAIGIDYFNENKDKIYETDSIHISTPKGGRRIKPPKYFDSLLEKDNAALLEEIKSVRQESADLKKKLMLDRTDQDYLSILEIEENLLQQRIKLLKRKEI